jgi:hypothetical protein
VLPCPIPKPRIEKEVEQMSIMPIIVIMPLIVMCLAALVITLINHG